MTPEQIYHKYYHAYDGDIQGCCLLIADEIHTAIGGAVVAGQLTWYDGSCRRDHWWVEKDGVVIDPMGEALLTHEEAPGREEVHRDYGIFAAVLPAYEQWRVR